MKKRNGNKKNGRNGNGRNGNGDGKKYRDSVVVKARTAGQKRYMQEIRDNDITFCVGPAGTGKTAVAVGVALQHLLAEHPTYDKLVIMRPVRGACGESIGYLPGDIMSKMAPWAAPVVDNMKVFIGDSQIKNLLWSGKTEIIPTAYARGRSLNRSYILVDESQNLSKDQLKMLLTRIGDGSKMVINGDVGQSDVNVDGLSWVMRRLEGVRGIGFCEMGLDDIVRNPIIAEIVRRFESGFENIEDDLVWRDRISFGSA